VGKEPIPPPGVPNPDAKAVANSDIEDKPITDFDDNEVPIEYGFAARMQYGEQYPDWNDDLERQLNTDWDANKAGRPFEDVKRYVRRGWDFRK
jgi:hypothetical protein